MHPENLAPGVALPGLGTTRIPTRPLLSTAYG
jgi:hypothetical protein